MYFFNKILIVKSIIYNGEKLYIDTVVIKNTYDFIEYFRLNDKSGSARLIMRSAVGTQNNAFTLC